MTVEDVARRAGVSTATVSRTVAGVHPELRAGGYSLLVIDTEEPEREAVRAADSRVVDGVLLVASTGEARTSLQTPRDVPMVAIDRAPSMLEIDVAQCDNEAGAREVMQHLIGCGHTRIAHIRGPVGLDVATQRARGYQDALASHGVPFDGRLVITGSFDEDSGFAAASALLTDPRPPTAIFAANDLMAIGAIAAAHQHGVRVPDDVAVAGFDGIHVGRYTQPALTTIVQPVADLARRGATGGRDRPPRHAARPTSRPDRDSAAGPARGPRLDRAPAPTWHGERPVRGRPAPHSDPTPAGAR